MAGVVDWFFRNRNTGAITIGQWPNALLILFSACAAAEWLFAPTGRTGQILSGLGTIALAVWALDEIARGVNPWRRCLGAAVIAWLVWSW
ncbi:hypothetical protein G3T14_05325 [Methylobacterium sp. BTF04]|uniref:hypothetical protein n=1 Tax=Methylobacterium sp. BTF04 TaxID=2708300 RepID=UPI0013CFFC68|nr:hypothetical protein [Methylobacterium sp. BTF04]NEU11548.1 hypothetical protein [Methylobacterium sp. BTF04]